MVVSAPQGPRLATRFGVNTVVAVGLMMVSGAMALFLLAGPGTAYLEIVPVVMIMAAGMAIAMPSMTGSIMSSVPMGKAGVGSAMNDTTRELGGALGVAVLGSLVASRYSNRLGPVIRSLTGPLRAKAEESLAGALQAAGQVGGPEGQRIADGARDAFVSGMHLAAMVAVCVGLVAAVLVYRLLPSTNAHTVSAASHGRQQSDLPAAGPSNPDGDLLAELDAH
jgi:hypothetical protein